MRVGLGFLGMVLSMVAGSCFNMLLQFKLGLAEKHRWVLPVLLAALAGAAVTTWLSTRDLPQVECITVIAERLTEDSCNSTQPSFSPDGRHIAYIADCPGNLDVYVMDSDGSTKVRRTETTDINEDLPSYTSDGTRIVFGERTGPDKGDIYVMLAEGASQPINLTSTKPRCQGRPRCSPYGRFITYDSNETNEFEVFVAVLGEHGLTNIRQISHAGYDDHLPSFSHKRRLLPFSRPPSFIVFRSHLVDDERSSSVYRCNFDGQGCQQIRQGSSMHYPVLLPGDKGVAYVSGPMENTAIYVMPLDGSGEKVLIGGSVAEDFPTFSRDGQWIAYTEKAENGNWVIYRKRLSRPG